MKFARFDSLENVEDGDNFFVVYPNGLVVLCCYSKHGYFSPEIEYGLMDEAKPLLQELPVIYAVSGLLVSKLILEN